MKLEKLEEMFQSEDKEMNELGKMLCRENHIPYWSLMLSTGSIHQEIKSSVHEMDVEVIVRDEIGNIRDTALQIFKVEKFENERKD